MTGSLIRPGNTYDVGRERQRNARLEEVLNSKQQTLVSGENIKSINGESLLGSGDIVVGDVFLDADNIFTGTNTFGDGVGNENIYINGGAGNNKNIRYQSNGVDRWLAGVLGVEGGANSGSNYTLRAYDDAGVSLGDALTIARSTKLVEIPSLSVALTGLLKGNGSGALTVAVAGTDYSIPGHTHTVALNDLTDVTVSGAAQGQVLARDGTDFKNLTLMTVTLGPFFINDLPGTATTQATIGYFNTATAVSRSTNDMKMNRAGRVVGLIVTSDDARTAGTATVRARINGTGTTFNAGAVILNGTNTTSMSSFVSWANGLAFTAGQTVGADVVTSGWTPITADLSVWIVVMFDPF
jgi:hypothetical protein